MNGEIIPLEEYHNSQVLLKKWSKAYYNGDQIATDDEYDKLYHECLRMEEEHPDLVTFDSCSQIVGFVVQDDFKKSSHIVKMQSMQDIFNFEQFETWFKKWQKEFPFLSVIAEPKFDGISLNLLYQNGKFLKAVTRGSGDVGEDVTLNAEHIRGIPKKISYKGKIEIRGEVIMSFKSLEKANLDRKSKNQKEFINARNAASGSLRNLDTEVTRRRNLEFLPWGIGYNILVFDTQTEIMEFIEDLGFTRNEHRLECTQEISDVKKYIDLMTTKRADLPFMIDGIAIKFDSIDYQDRAGYTNKFPRFQQALKFPAVEKVTKILGVGIQVGSTGTLTPVAHLEPIFIDGSVVKRASMHNFDQVKEKGFMIGDEVVIIKSGDIIPYLVKPLIDRRDGTETEIEIPEVCPKCDHKTITISKEETTSVLCPNNECSGTLTGRLIKFASRNKMNIDGLGDKVAEQLIKYNVVSHPFDLYSLKKEDLLKLEGFKERKAQKIIDNIAGTIGTDLKTCVASLGILNVGNTTSDLIISEFQEDSFTKSIDQLVEIKGIGIETATAWVDYWKEYPNRIDFILNTLKATHVAKHVPIQNIFLGKKVAITGTFNSKRTEMISTLELLGAKITKSISKKTDFLICGQDAGSKLEKAQSLKITILMENDYTKIIKN